MKPEKVADRILKNVPFMVLSTVDQNGQPWGCTLSYSIDKDLNIYWRSAKNSQHTRNLSANPRVFLSIFDPTVPEPGLYLKAKAEQLEELADIMRALSVDRHPEFSDEPGAYLGHNPRRYYKAVPLEAWISADSEENGKFVDVRKPVPLPDLKEITK